MMKRIIVIILVLAVVGGVSYWAYGQYQAQQQAEAAAKTAAEAQAAGDLEQVIWASGKLQPVVWAGLAPSGSGTVENIYVHEGETVKTGDLLLELQNAVAQSQVKVAEAALTEAQTALAKLRAKATAADIAAGEAAVEEGLGEIGLAVKGPVEGGDGLRVILPVEFPAPLFVPFIGLSVPGLAQARRRVEPCRCGKKKD